MLLTPDGGPLIGGGPDGGPRCIGGGPPDGGPLCGIGGCLFKYRYKD